MTNDFFEEIPIELRLGREASPGEVNRALRSLGFHLNYDVYSLARPGSGPHPKWQSENIAEVELLRNGKEVDAQDPCDTIRFIYPLATIDSSMINPFVKAVSDTMSTLRCSLFHDNIAIDVDTLSQHLTKCATDLLQKWGEEPGSKTLRLMIMRSHAG